MKVTVKNVRLAFPSIFKATRFNDGDPTYSATLILPPDSEADKAVAQAVNEVAKAQWKDKSAAAVKAMAGKDNICYRTSEKCSQAGEVFDGFAGMHWLKANSKARPTVLDRDKSPLTEDDGKPYSGCYVNVIVDIWAQASTQFGNRINCTLKGVQFVKDGESFGGSKPADVDEFDDLGVDEDGDLL